MQLYTLRTQHINRNRNHNTLSSAPFSIFVVLSSTMMLRWPHW